MSLIAGTLGTALTLLSAGTAGQASTMQGSPPDDPQAAQVIDDIIVTAQKREQRLQDVPITVSVVGAQQLQDAGFRDVKDLGLVAPGVAVSTSTAETQAVVRIRGVGTAGDNPGLESAVGVVVDGVYRPRNGVAFSDLGEIDRIEVLRGPQGTLFGKNTSAGVVSVVTRRPTFVLQGRGELSVGSDGGFDALGNVSGPLSETLAGSLYVAHRQRDGFLDVVTGAGPRTKAEDQDRYYSTVRGRLLYMPSDRLSLDLIADYTNRDENCCAAVSYIQGPTAGFVRALAGVSGLPATADPFGRTAYANRGSSQTVEDAGVSLEATYDTGLLGDATLTSITAVRDWQVTNGQDVDNTGADILYRNGDGTLGQQFRTVSQELRLAGSTGRLDWLVGAFYANEKLTRHDSVLVGRDYAAYLSYLFTAGVPAPFAPSGGRFGCFTAAVYSQACVVGLAPATGLTPLEGAGYADVHDQTSDSFALFTNNSVQLTEALELTLGLRFTQERKSVTSRYDNVGQGNGVCASALANASPATVKPILCLPMTNPFFEGLTNTQRIEEDAVTGTARLAYRFNPELMVFVSYARGFKFGGFNLDRVLSGVTPVLDTHFEAETVDAYEIGAKSDLFDRKLSLNVSVYYQRIENFQINAFQGLSYTVLNVPELESSGVDLDFNWRTPVEGLRLQGGGSYNRARFGDDLVPGFPYVPGGQASYAPEWSGNLGVTYERPLPRGLQLRTNLTGAISSGYNTGGDLDPVRVQDGVTLVNARAGVGPTDGRWTLEAWARNLLDENVVGVIFPSPLQTGSYSATIGEPQTYGATLRYRF